MCDTFRDDLLNIYVALHTELYCNSSTLKCVFDHAEEELWFLMALSECVSGNLKLEV